MLYFYNFIERRWEQVGEARYIPDMDAWPTIIEHEGSFYYLHDERVDHGAYRAIPKAVTYAEYLAK